MRFLDQGSGMSSSDSAGDAPSATAERARHCPSIPTPVDTTPARDAITGGFCAALAAGLDDATGMRRRHGRQRTRRDGRRDLPAADRDGDVGAEASASIGRQSMETGLGMQEVLIDDLRSLSGDNL